MTDGPPVFDGPRFATWLRKYMAAEGIGASELARRSGLSRSMVTTLRRGRPTNSKIARANGQTTFSPVIDTVAAIAWALDLELGYVASRAGLDDSGDRWRNFSEAERQALAAELGVDPGHLDACLQELAAPTKEVV